MKNELNLSLIQPSSFVFCKNIEEGTDLFIIKFFKPNSVKAFSTEEKGSGYQIRPMNQHLHEKI